jgi:hypothetical protein
MPCVVINVAAGFWFSNEIVEVTIKIRDRSTLKHTHTLV